MKKDKAWALNEIDNYLSLVRNSEERGALWFTKDIINQLDEPEVKQLERKIKELESFNDGLIRDNYQFRNELDNQEVLSQEWIDEHLFSLGDKYPWKEAVPVVDLQSLLVPKQGELEVKIQKLIETYKQEEGAYSNPENGWIGGFVEDLKNLLEEEQKYYVVDKYNQPLIGKTNTFDKNAILKVTNLTGWFSGYCREEYQLTEQEIKDYDPRYWAFRKQVEELEE